MWKKIAVIGGAAAIIGGAGTAAVASSATATPTPSPSSVSTPSNSSAGVSKPDKQARADRIRRAVHATWVTHNKKTGTFTTHDAIRGRVIAVSATSITVRAADSTTETYLVTARTKVFTRAPRTAASKAATTRAPLPRTTASISDVKAGDSVLVGGTGTTALTALRVVDVR